MGALLYSLCVPSVFGGSAEFHMNKSNLFIQCVLAAITLVQDWSGDGWAKARVKYESLAVQALSESGLDPELMDQKPRGLCPTWLCFL